MNNVITMAIIECVSESFDNLADLCLSFTPMGVFRIIEFASFHTLHDNVEIIRIIIYLVDFYYIGMLKLIYRSKYAKHNFALILINS